MLCFVCNRSLDSQESRVIIDELLCQSGMSVIIAQESESSVDWQKRVARKIEMCDCVLFLLGEDTHTSESIIWEYEESKRRNKRIYGLKLRASASAGIHRFSEVQLFDSPEQCVKNALSNYLSDRNVKMELFKILINSTEKVTEQRLKVNNIFLTVVSSILSASFIVGKSFQFSFLGSVVMLLLTLIALILTYFWEKLLASYGTLNMGKFELIGKMEKQFNVSMFKDEWSILRNQFSYKSNTQTELSITRKFRYAIMVFVVLEVCMALTNFEAIRALVNSVGISL